MDELTKIKRVMEKVVPGAPHEVLLVLDATHAHNPHFHMAHYLFPKSDSTKARLLNNCKSSIPSPIPIYFTGIESIEKIMDALAAKERGELRGVYVMGCLSERYQQDRHNEASASPHRE
mgnify:CR=1 FL=1